MALNARQKTFVKEYLIDKNATRAAKAAGYAKKTANVCGPRLLSNASVAKAVKTAIEKQGARLDLSADRVLIELARCAFLDLSKAVDKEKGTLLDLHVMPEDTRRAVTGVEVEELFEGRGRDREHIGRLKKVKTADKVRALEILAKHFKLFSDDTKLVLPADGIKVTLTMPANGSEAPKEEDNGSG